MAALFSRLVLFVVCFYCQAIGVVIHSQPTRETIAGVLVTSRVESRGQEIASGEGQVAVRNDLLRACLNEVWTRSPSLFVAAPHMRPGALTRDHGPPVSDRVSCSGGGTAWHVLLYPVSTVEEGFHGTWLLVASKHHGLT